MRRPLRIALIASVRHPIREPFAGGLEGHTWTLAAELTRRGHRVALFAHPGSDPALGLRHLDVARPHLSDAAQRDTSMPDREWLDDHHAYLRLMLDLADGREQFDVVHNNSLHYLPIAMAPALPMPVITTLHTPPTPWLESAMQCRADSPVRFTAVSAHTARAWHPLIPEALVVPNGIDIRRWIPGPGGEALVWSGRIVPEKDPETAVRAARAAGRRLCLAGPIADPGYFRSCIAPLLGDGIDYVGHLRRRELAHLVGHSAAALVTPAWDEPYGLVVAEALACATPVCALDRGALSELLPAHVGRLVPVLRGDLAQDMADAIADTVTLDRQAARRHAEQHCSASSMVDAYEAVYQAAIPGPGTEESSQAGLEKDAA